MLLMYLERIGHGADHTILPDERSPIFLQYLECCFQIMHQFPTAFEFNDSLLVFIADHLISGLFGNFLGNTDQERKMVYCVQENTQSIWSYVLHYRSQYLNPQYVKYENVLWPSYAYNHLKVWERYWLRYDLFSHPNSLNVQSQWLQDDW
jgi:myotubularin-related protein 1/2